MSSTSADHHTGGRGSGAPMRRVSLRNLAAHKVRLALTVLSVVLGTAFVAGSFVFTDTLQRTFDSIFDDTATGVDVRVSPEEQGTDGVPLADAETVSSLPGVRAVAPAESGQVVLIGPDGSAVQTGGAPSIGTSYVPAEQAVEEPDPYVAGAPPSAPGEVGINPSAAERANLAVGDDARVLVPAHGIVDVTISGLYDPGTDTGGFIGVQFTQQQAVELFTDGRHAAYVDVAGDGSRTPEQLQADVQQALPDMKVQTGDEVRAETEAQVSQALDFVNYFLLAFGAIALLVGTFIIYNTFSMIVAQRLRELALLRAIGASQGQIGRSVTLEALVVGILGAIAGTAAGIGLAYVLRALLNAFDLGLPEGPLVLSPRTFAVSIGVGVLVTVISAYAPARRASRVAPVAAMREEASGGAESLTVRTWVGAVFTVAGVVALVIGSRGTGEPAAATVGLGALATIVGVFLVAPALSRPVVRTLGLATRPFGAVGKLARTNAVRNPRRTSATAFALTLGLMLVSVIGVFGASAKASVDELVDNGITADWILSGPNQIGVPEGVEGAVSELPDVARAASLHLFSAEVDGERETGGSLDGSTEGLVNLDVVRGSGDPGPGEIIVSDTKAAERGWDVGSPVTVTGADGKQTRATVGGVFVSNQLFGDLVVSDDVYRATSPAVGLPAILVLIEATPGADADTLRADLEQSTSRFIVVQVQDRDEFKGAQAAQIDTLLAILYGLLALAVVIAILGIVNTLALSVVERTREIGMLRAVGTQRSQVRRTIYLESMLIAVFGAVVGIVLGVAFGWAFVSTLRDQGLGTFQVPWEQIVAMLVGSGVVGVLAALWPAVRAARTDPLDAISES
ncbi:ABC transporter permease [Rhodococcus rhodnii]